MNVHLVAAYCAGLVTPFALVAFAVTVVPVLEWLDGHTRPAFEDPDGPSTVEIPAVHDDEPATVRISDAWDLAARDLTRPRTPKHRAP